MDEITREDWIDYEWHEITMFGDKERRFMVGLKSTPFERAKKIAEYEYIDREDARRKENHD